ncbi:AMP-binding protein [Streptomyces diastatochromogenes]|nr:AMP-binding protein [Streptomyces diastatochromogenes]
MAARPDRPAGPLPTVAFSGRPDATALICGDDRVTYAGLDAMTGGLAGALGAAGVGAGSPVGVLLRRSPWSVAAIEGVWRAGGCTSPGPRTPCGAAAVHGREAQLACVVADPRPCRRPRHWLRSRSTSRPSLSPPTGPGTAPIPVNWPTSSSRPAPPAVPRRSASNTPPSPPM